MICFPMKKRRQTIYTEKYYKHSANAYPILKVNITEYDLLLTYFVFCCTEI